MDDWRGFAISITILFMACILSHPVHAEMYCSEVPQTGHRVCHETVRDERGLSYYMYGIDSYTKYTYTYRPRYDPEVPTPPVSTQHPWGDCMISMGCTR